MHRLFSVAAVLVLLGCMVSVPRAQAASAGEIRGDSCMYLYQLWSVANVTDAMMTTYKDALSRDDIAYRSAALAQIDSAIKDKEGVLDLLHIVKAKFHVSRGHDVYWLPFHSLSYAALHLSTAAAAAETNPVDESATTEFNAAQTSMKHTWRSLNHIPCA